MSTRKKTTSRRPAAETDEPNENRPDPASGGQSGDTQGLSDVPQAESQSVKELAEEGQFYEAAIVSGVENALNADASEVTTKEAPEDDVPLEYIEQERERPTDD